ncbi:MAG: NAD-dependent succinate-semialdehyde dehydrogenase [Thermodesulfobacteriota bacterium]|nr:NAD-dependent succinate-semialdehyde dehydrogenase [Thermodesulfobacteriota bacterium]
MLRTTNPVTGETVKEMDSLDIDKAKQLIAGVDEAFIQWRKTDFEQRARVLNDVASYMRENKERLALFMTDEMGKPIKEARGEVEKSAWCAEHYALNARIYLEKDLIATDATTSYVQYMPLGVILGILPWNAPFWLAFRFLAPALMAGNTCVMRHASNVPDCATAIAGLFDEVGAPANIVKNLPVESKDVEHVIRDPRIRAVSLTGSSKVGTQVASIAASEIKPAVLELGGSDPVVVLNDADLDAAADIITLSRNINAGQSCIAAKRIIVVKDVYDTMVEKMKSRLSTLKVGDPRREDTDIGPLAKKDTRDKIHRQVIETLEAGAQCLLGGEIPDGDGFFYPVTLLIDVLPNMVSYKEETFGPVAVMIKAEDADHAIKLANDTEYGLGASIWTGDKERGEALASEIFAGQVSVNGIVKTDPRLPSGGVKRSGYGRELGPHGIRQFVNTQQIWIGPKIG